MNKKRTLNKLLIWPFLALSLLLSPFSNSLEDDFHLIETKDVSETKYWDEVGPASDYFDVLPLNIDIHSAFIFNLDNQNFSNSLSSEFRHGDDGEVYLPLANGRSLKFTFFERSNFAPELALKYPGITAFRGYSTEYPQIIAYLSSSPLGIDATVINTESGNRTYIHEISKDDRRYVSYTEFDHTQDREKLICSTGTGLEDEGLDHDHHHDSKVHQKSFNDIYSMSRLTQFSNESALSTYRIAVAANGQYTSYHGGTVQAGLAAINNLLTGLNFITETDLGVRVELVANNDLVVYTDANTDPFDDSLSGANSALQQDLDSVIGSENYDVGHLFSGVGGGGNAGAIGSVCNSATKGSAWSASSQPRGSRYVNLVAHELGHQLGANHTYSFNSEGTGVNVEPASGTTIMSYAGTGFDDIAFYADNYYHNVSVVQALTYLYDQSCDVSTDNGNSLPVITPQPNILSYSIPIGTPFYLEATATDADEDDSLTYVWEQIDDGVVTSNNFGPNNASGAAFRSIEPSSDGNRRYFPRLSSVLSGELTQSDPYPGATWETLSLVPRSYDFRMTARDNAVGGGGLLATTATVNVWNNDGVFEVTSQDIGNVYIAESDRTVTWNVAGTDQEPISTSSVNIKMSVDGGQTYPYELSPNSIPNNGSYEVTMPNVVTSSARIKVSPVGNVYYSVNSQDFSITVDDIVLTVDELDYGVCQGDSVVSNIIYETNTKYTDTATFTAENVPDGMTVTFDPATATKHNTPVTATFTSGDNLAANTYDIDVVATSPERSQRLTYQIQNFSRQEFEEVNLNGPVNQSVISRLFTTLEWASQPNATSYTVEIASDEAFTDVLLTRDVDGTSTEIRGLTRNTTYYWRVAPRNFCGSGTAGSAYSFTTPNHLGALDVPVQIADNTTDVEYTSTLSVNENLRITDLNVYLGIQHTWPQDLTITMQGPSGQDVQLLNQPCGGDDDIDVVFDDELGEELVCSANPPSVSGVLRPSQGNLSSFNEQSTKGDWVLSVLDGFDLDGGSIDYFALEIETDGEWSNTAPIAFPQATATNEQTTDLTLQGLDPERLPLTYTLIDAPSVGNILGQGYTSTLLGSANTIGTSRDIVLSSDGTRAFIADGDEGLRVFDVSVPSAPLSEGGLDVNPGNSGSSRGIALSSDDSTIFIADSLGGVKIVDVQGGSYSIVGDIDTNGNAVGIALSPDEQTVFVADSVSVKIIDVSTPSLPSLISQVTTSAPYGIDVSPDGNTVYVADQLDGLCVIDISGSDGLSNPELVQCLSTPGFSSGVKVAPDGQNVYLADFATGVRVYRTSNPLNPVSFFQLDTDGNSYQIDVSADGSQIFLADDNGVKALEVEQNGTLTQVGDLSLNGTSYSVAAGLDGTNVFVATGDSGLQAVGFEKATYNAGDELPQAIVYEGDETLPSGYTGTFTFQVSDGELQSNIASVDVTFNTEPLNNGTYTYTNGADGNIAVTGCLNTCPVNIEIPRRINGRPVTAISDAAFAESNSPIVLIPDTVTSVGDYAFLRSFVSRVTIGAGVTSIGKSAFAFNQLDAVSFLGNRPSLETDSFSTNRALNYISYCPDKAGWPGDPISAGTVDITPVAACDSVNKNNEALDNIKNAVLSKDAASITEEDLNSVLGLQNIASKNMDLYRGVIQVLLDLSFGEVRLSDLQALIDDANARKESCSLGVYIIDVLEGEQPAEISWSLKDESDNEMYGGGAPLDTLACIADGRYLLEMSDTNAAGTANGWDYGEFVITEENGSKLFRHTILSGTDATAPVNLGDYPNQSPIADEIPDVELELGQSVDFVLSGSDPDSDATDFVLHQAPDGGEIHSYMPGSGVVAEYFLGGDTGIRGLAISPDQKYAYLADHTYGLKVLDISDIKRPILVGQYAVDNGGQYNVSISNDGNTVYLASIQYGVRVIDVSNPLLPKLQSGFDREGTAYPLGMVESADGNTLYVAAYEFFLSIDVSDKTNATQNFSVGTAGFYSWDIVLSPDEQIAFLASGPYVKIYDISDPLQAVLITDFVSSGDNDGDGTTDGTARSLRLSADGNTLYVANGGEGTRIIDVSDASAPQLLGYVPANDFVFGLGISADGSMIYSSASNGELQTIDVIDPQNPVLIRTTASVRDPWRLAASNDNKYVFVSDGYTGFKVIDTSYSARAQGDPLSADITYKHIADLAVNDSFTFVLNDGKENSNDSVVSLIFAADKDGDGIEDDLDNCPSTPNSDQLDTDGDGIGNACDDDDDNDGVDDVNDAFPLDATETTDTDGDGIGNNADTDDDGDGVSDSQDDAPLDPTNDTDGDGAPNNADAFPLDNTETLDTDGDGIGNNADPDDDNDGVDDANDPWPLQSEYTRDTDSDGMPDEWELRFDLDPNDPSDAAGDLDGDGISNLQEFLNGTPASGSIDIDGNEKYDALTDGLLMLRHMFGLTGDALITDTVAADAQYKTSDEIESRISLLGELADIDGNGEIDALTDGLIVVRYLFGLRGSSLIEGAVAENATLSSEQIEARLESLTPVF
ncbi:M12 family metallo-peptidase [Gammaproteobacteria bacterium]|nr:M12 family metallo-peptidase [Gammaproteobacteria bacterium]